MVIEKQRFFRDPHGSVGILLELNNFSCLLSYENETIELWNIKDVEEVENPQLSLFGDVLL